MIEFQLSYLKSWKMTLWKCGSQYASKYGTLSSGQRIRKGQFSFQSQRKAMAKNAQTTAQLHLSHTPVQFSSVQSLSRVRLFVTPWIAARQDSLSITSSRSLPKSMSIKSMPSSHLILCHPLFLLPPILHSIRVFSNESNHHMRRPVTGVSALAAFLSKKSQGWSPSEWTGWISLQSKGLSRVFSNTTVQKHQFFGAQPSSKSNSHIHTWWQEKP